MGLREAARPRHDGDSDVPEVLVLVVLLETDAAVFGLTDVCKRKTGGLGLAEEEVHTDPAKFLPLDGFVEAGTWNHDRLDDTGGDLGDPDTARISGRAIDLNGLATDHGSLLGGSRDDVVA
jgi:hypothetical protein